jgi:hypothetical protein
MGYFSKLMHAHVFIVQDNALASNRVWVNRSKIIRPDGQLGYITLPIGERGDARISDIALTSAARQESARRISMSIDHAYARSRHFSEWKTLKPHFLEIMESHSRLIDIDMALIIALLERLGVPLPGIYLASHLQCRVDLIDTLVSNCRETSCDALILGRGNRDWSATDTDRMRQAGVTPLDHDFYDMHPEYYQTRRERLGFCRGLSILDCLLNEGSENTASLLRQVPARAIADGHHD